MPESAAEILARIQPTLREHIEHICLRPDLIDRFQDLETELNSSRIDDAAGTRLGTGVSSKTRNLAEQVIAAGELIKAGSMRCHFTALPTDKFEALAARHKPRKGNDYDMLVGYDREAVQNALLRACLDDPVFDDQSWAHFRSVCPIGEMNALREAVQIIHPQAAVLPKSVLATEILSGPANDSTPRRRGGRRPASSTDGSDEKSTSPTTSTSKAS